MTGEERDTSVTVLIMIFVIKLLNPLSRPLLSVSSYLVNGSTVPVAQVKDLGVLLDLFLHSHAPCLMCLLTLPEVATLFFAITHLRLCEILPWTPTRVSFETGPLAPVVSPPSIQFPSCREDYVIVLLKTT